MTEKTMGAHRRLRVVRNSELEGWRRCNAFWGFRYVDGLEPALRAAALDFGTMYHAGVEAGWRAAWEQSTITLENRYHRAVGAYPAVLAAKAEERIKAIEVAALDDQSINVDELVGETEEERDIAQWAVGHYFECAKSDLAMFPIAIEQEVLVRIPDALGRANSLGYAGRVDLVLWDHESQQVRVDDHKSTGGAVVGVEKRVQLDTQLTGYVVSVREMLRTGQLPIPPDVISDPAFRQDGEAMQRWLAGRVGGICYNVIRRARPNTPSINLLKKGEAITSHQLELLAMQTADGESRGAVSVAAIDTLPEVYAKALEAQFYEREIPISDKQKSVLEGLKAKGDTYFAQFNHYRGEPEIDRWRRELWVESRRMREAERNPELRTRNPGACTLPQSPACVYAGPCMGAGSPESRVGFRVVRAESETTNHGGEKESIEESL